MNKFVINSVKINSVNGQSLPLKEFTDGFNIICGANEAGKSTMMLFLKEALFSPKGFSGEIEFTKSDTKYQIKIDGNKSKNLRLKLLAPADKTVADFLDGLDRNFYQRAFTINLDDIKNIDTELFSLIQDHNAPFLAQYKAKLESEIRAYLTETWRPNKNLSGIIKSIENIDAQIRELSCKEEEYSKIVSKITTVCNEIDYTGKLKENKEKVLSGDSLKLQLETLIKENEKLKNCFNSRLYDNKQLFYDLSKKTEFISRLIDEINNLTSSNILQQINEGIAALKLRYNVECDRLQLENIDASRELEVKIREHLSNLSNKKAMLENLLSRQQELSETGLELSEEISELKSKLKTLNIQNIKEFEKARGELKDAIGSLADFSENGRIGKNKFILAGNVIIALFLILLGILALPSLKICIPVIAAGTILGLLTYLSYKSGSSIGTDSDVYCYLKKNVIPVLCTGEDFLCTAAALNRLNSESDTRFDTYNSLQIEIDKKNKVLVHNETELKANIAKVDEIKSFIENINVELNKLTSINGKLLGAENFIDFIVDIRELRELSARHKSEMERLNLIEKEVDGYLKNFSDFLLAAGLENNVTPASLRDKVAEIHSIIEENNKLKNELETNTNRINEIENYLKVDEFVDKAPDKSLDELKADYENLLETRAQLLQEKRTLEQFEGIVGLRNERNRLQNCLDELINGLYAKKLVLNIINYAEKQQRLIEPNLMSAENFLKQITNGKYINTNYANKTITSQEGETKSENELSRGTREQLYLAFRLGYAFNYGRDGNKFRLPLIIDDAFVNFDKERLSAVLKALQEFALTNQVLFFTCHKDYILPLLKESSNDVNTVDI